MDGSLSNEIRKCTRQIETAAQAIICEAEEIRAASGKLFPDADTRIFIEAIAASSERIIVHAQLIDSMAIRARNLLPSAAGVAALDEVREAIEEIRFHVGEINGSAIYLDLNGEQNEICAEFILALLDDVSAAVKMAHALSREKGAEN